MIVRLSRGQFDAAQHDEIDRMLRESAVSLVPAIRKLPGGLHDYAGIDRGSATMVNVSVRDPLEHAQHMGTLAEMRAQGERFRARGVRFETIVSYETVWDIAG